jgi:predicted DCC family thiol-disulfide oxidoreductase YuxK
VRGERLQELGESPAEFHGRWILIWDGDCGFCRRWVEHALRHDKSGKLGAVPYQQCVDWLPQSARERSPHQAHLRSPDGRYWAGGDAAIRLIGLLGYGRFETLLSLPPLRMLTRSAYRLVARNRARLASWGL